MKPENLIVCTPFLFSKKSSYRLEVGDKFECQVRSDGDGLYWVHDIYEKTTINKTPVRVGSCLIWNEKDLSHYKDFLVWESELKC